MGAGDVSIQFEWIDNYNWLNITVMFTFHTHDNPIQLHPKSNIAPIPQLVPPAKLFSLPPLHFSPEAAQPISNFAPIENASEIQKYKQIIETLEESHKKELVIMNDKLSALYDEYMREKREHEMLKQRYQEGESIFIQLQSENQNLQRQLSALRVKKLQKNRNSLGKPKEVPIVKISVPNPKSMANTEQPVYRQLKSVNDELAQTKLMLESEKESKSSLQTMLNKTIDQLSTEKQFLRKENNLLREQIREERENREKRNMFSPYQNTKQIFTVPEEDQTELQKVKEELQRLKRVHKSCDVLLASKQTQIQNMQWEISKAKQREVNLFRPQVIEDKDKRQQTEFLSNKFSFLPQEDTRIQFLEQHLNLSVKEMKSIEGHVKVLLEDYIAKIEQLRNQIEWANKKSEHQQFELERVYELLRDKKTELQNCYRDLTSAKKKTRNSAGFEQQDANLKSLLKDRKDFSS